MGFARLEAIRLEELHRRAVEDWVEASLAVGGHADVVGELAALTLEYPLRERLWGQFMIALARCGRQAEALRAYEQLRRQLARELGIAPSVEVQEIELGIVTQAPQVVHPSTLHMADSLHGYLLREQVGRGRMASCGVPSSRAADARWRSRSVA
jgi:DNA-binding SARP family transcriptional activator